MFPEYGLTNGPVKYPSKFGIEVPDLKTPLPYKHFVSIAKYNLPNLQWTPGNPTNVLQGSVELWNLSDYTVLPKTPYSHFF